MEYLNKVNRFERIRWSIIIVLALLIAHYFAYEKIPFISEGYKFPWKTFGLALIFGSTICHSNTTIYKKLNIAFPLRENLRKRILLQFIYIWIVTAIIFSLLYLGINGVLLNKKITFISFSFFLFISIFISTFEGLILILLEVYKLYQSAESNLENINNGVAVEEKKYLPIKTVSKITNLNINNIAYVNSKNGIVIIKDLDKNKFITQYTSINEIIDYFPDTMFYRVNRQYLLNKEIIEKLEDDVNRKINIFLNPAYLNHIISCSRYKNKEIKNWFNNTISKD